MRQTKEWEQHYLSGQSKTARCIPVLSFQDGCPEQNDVGNQELLVVKLALEEWRHWLEEAEHSLIFWTDHKILLLSEKQRDSTLAGPGGCCYLIASPLLSYSSRNIKPDVLSRLFDPEPDTKQPETLSTELCG